MEPQGDRHEIFPIYHDDHVLGPDTAEMTVVAYCDFLCPYCRRAFSMIKRIQSPLEGRLRYVFRHFPLIDKHPSAQQVAEIAEAAGAQGRFWPMHDFLYLAHGVLRLDEVESYAKQLGLDGHRLKQEVTDRVYADRVERDRQEGLRRGVIGTPTFFFYPIRRTDDEDVVRQVLRRAA